MFDVYFYDCFLFFFFFSGFLAARVIISELH